MLKKPGTVTWIVVVSLIVIGVIIYRRLKMNNANLTDSHGVKATYDSASGKYFVAGKEAVKCCYSRYCNGCGCAQWKWIGSGDSCDDPGCNCGPGQLTNNSTQNFRVAPVEFPQNDIFVGPVPPVPKPKAGTTTANPTLSNIAAGKI